MPSREVCVTSPVGLALLGLGLGALIVAGRWAAPSRSPSTRDRAIDAQRVADRAAQHARELAERARLDA